jgi:hypothetical protein
MHKINCDTVVTIPLPSQIENLFLFYFYYFYSLQLYKYLKLGPKYIPLLPRIQSTKINQKK